MPGVAYLQLFDEDEEAHPDDLIALHSSPLFDVYGSDLDFSLSDVPPIPFNSQSFNRQNQASFVMNLFHQRVEQSIPYGVIEPTDPDFFPTFNFMEGDDEMDSPQLNLDLDLGLGLGLQIHECNDDEDGNSGFMVADADGGDEFFVSMRDGVSESGESSTVSGGPEYFMGLRFEGIDSDEADREVLGVSLDFDEDFGCDDVDDSTLPLCWDSFQLEDHRGDVNEDFEWEEVDARVDEREVLNMYFDVEGDEDASVLAFVSSREEVDSERASLGNFEWQVLLNMSANEGPDGESFFGDHDEYGMLFGQLAENENGITGRPPASKTAVENLVSVVMTKEDVDNGNAFCVVCKDDVNVGERVTQLPCAHRYHKDCIEPWLGIRNTCPVCRFELPTEDTDYERRRAQRENHAQ